MDCTKGSFSTLRHKAIKAVNNNLPANQKALWQTADTRKCLPAARGLINFVKSFSIGWTLFPRLDHTDDR